MCLKQTFHECGLSSGEAQMQETRLLPVLLGNKDRIPRKGTCASMTADQPTCQLSCQYHCMVSRLVMNLYLQLMFQVFKQAPKH